MSEVEFADMIADLEYIPKSNLHFVNGYLLSKYGGKFELFPLIDVVQWDDCIAYNLRHFDRYDFLNWWEECKNFSLTWLSDIFSRYTCCGCGEVFNKKDKLDEDDSCFDCRAIECKGCEWAFEPDELKDEGLCDTCSLPKCYACDEVLNDEDKELRNGLCITCQEN